MTEENKNEKAETPQEKKAVEEPKRVEEPKKVAEPKKAEEPKKPEESKKAETAKKEKPANCAGCNKSIRKKRWYYRNGKSYCTKRCWKTASKKEPKADSKAKERAA